MILIWLLQRWVRVKGIYLGVICNIYLLFPPTLFFKEKLKIVSSQINCVREGRTASYLLPSFDFTQGLPSVATVGCISFQPHQYINWLVGAALSARSQCLHSYI